MLKELNINNKKHKCTLYIKILDIIELQFLEYTSYTIGQSLWFLIRQNRITTESIKETCLEP